MRISLDARFLHHAGIGRFIEGLWGGLLESGVEVTALVAPSGRQGWRPTAGHAVGPTETVAARPFLLQEQLHLPRLLARLHIDVHHATHLSVPYASSRPVVLTVHDLFPIKWPWHARSRAAWAYYRSAFPAALRRADLVVAVSEYTRRQIQELLPVDPSKLRVIEHGLDHSVWTPQPETRIQSVLAGLDVPRPFVLYAGTAKKHKNLALLAEAWSPALPPLVLAGPSRAEALASAPGLARDPRTVALGRVPTDALAVLYSGAAAVVLPSLHESVGFTALEAMACGTPLVSSDGGCLPDTVGDGGLLLAADQPAAWRRAVQRVVTDTNLAQELVARGRAQVMNRTWRTAANAYVDAYSTAMRRG